MKAFFNSKHLLKIKIMRLVALILVGALSTGYQVKAAAEFGMRKHADLSKVKAWQKDASNAVHFMENKGQVLDFSGNPASFVKFALDRDETMIFLLKEPGIAWQFQRVHYPDGYEELHLRRGDDRGDFLGKLKELNAEVRTETYRMDMVLQHANPNPTISTEGKSEDYFNYYNNGVLEVHHFEKVTYHDVYPGIDWVVYTNESGLKYDFIVHPGADPNQIKLEFRHHEELYLDDEGNLIHGNRLGNFTEFAPVSFQKGREVHTHFKLDNDILRFELGDYNLNETLIIDPARIWATYYGGSGFENGYATDVDNEDNVYLAGRTGSSNNIASGGHQETIGGFESAFLVKFNSSGVRLWGTYYGGSNDDGVWECAIDGSNNVYVAGWSYSSDNIASGGHQNTLGGDADAMLVKFNSSGVLQWATYYGGTGQDFAVGCATAPDGSVYMTGETNSANNIASGGHQNAFGGSTDAFLVKFNAMGVRQWGTYYGGSGAEQGTGCAADALGNVYLTGFTGSTSAIADGGHQNTFGGGSEDAFLVKFNSSGVRQWGTYYGGAGTDRGVNVAVDPDQNIVVAGASTTPTGLASGGHQNVNNGSWDALLVKFDPMGVRQWATYYGSSGDDQASSCAIDGLGNIYFSGWSNSVSGIASGGFQNANNGGYDGILVKFSTSGVLDWATYYGGADWDFGHACAVDSEDNVYLAGNTPATSGIASGGHQNVFGGGFNDAFLVKFEGAESPATPCIHSLVYGFATAPGNNVPAVAATCALAGGYIEINSVVSGETYEFASSTATDWLVLTDDADNVLVEGTTPINWIATFNGTVHLHISEDSDCNTGGGCRQPTVTCTSCGSPPCLHPNEQESVFAPADTIPFSIPDCVFPEQYITVLDVTLDKTYIFSSSIATDWFVLTDDANNVLAEGTTPITWTATFNGTVRLHLSTDAECGVDTDCREITIQCTTCLNFASCVHSIGIGDASAPSNSIPVSISSCVFAGNYNTVNDLVAGQTYEFTSSVGTDWLLLTDEANNLLSEGTTPISWTATFSGTVRLHISANANCGTEGLCRTTTVACTSCSLVSCAFEDAFGSGSASGVNIVVSITTCVFAGEYSVIENIAAGSTYEFTSSVETDWLVLTDAANNTLVEGTTPISWNATFSGTVRLHVSAASDCSTEMDCRETTVQCTSCPSPTGCIHGQEYELVSAPSSNEVNTIINCSFAGEYNTILDIVDGQTYNFSSSTSSDWLVLTDNADNLLLEGDSPISWTATFSGSVRLHISTDPNCGSQNLCRDITIVCTSCPGSASICCDDPFVGAGCPQYPGCEDAICALDPFCCDVTWDADCVTAALLLCGVEECTPIDCVAPTVNFNSFIDCSTGTYELSVDIGDNGNASFYQVQIGAPACDQPQSFVGFPDDVACQDAICAVDVFCCVIEWDAACAAAASSNSACTGCLAPQATTIGLFQGGTSGTLGTFPIGTEVDVYILHNWSSTCSQFFTVGATGSCGCTDPEATNFDPDATFDDGSCNYTLFNNNCSGAVSLNVVEWPDVNNTLGTLTGATGSGLPACTGVSGLDVFYSFHAATHNHYIINLNAFGGFEGAVVELWDGCSGSLVECFAADPTTDCGQAQGFGNAGFPADLTCETAVCGQDPFCCDNTWDGLCAGIALNEEATACAGCLGGDPAFPALALELPAGDYILRVRNEDGSLITDATGDFLIGVQSFPVAQVQDNPMNPLYACNQSGFQLEDIVGASPQTTGWILDYEWQISEIGGGTSNIWQRGEPNYSTRPSWLGMEYGVTYNVYVRVLVNHPVFGPTWGVFQVDGPNPNAPGASICTVAMSNNVTPTEVRPQYTPTNAQGNPYSLCDLVVAFNVENSEDFRWQFDDGSGSPIEYQRNAPNPAVRLSWVPGLIPGSTYNVAVEVQVGGQWSGYSTVHPITLALPPNNMAVRPQFCGVTHAPSAVILVQAACAYDFYEWEFVNLSTGVTSTAQRPNPGISLNWNQISPLLTAGDYEARVRVQQGGILGDYGPVCTFTISGPEAPADETPALRTMAENSSMLYPNPNMGTEVRLELAGLGDDNHEVMIQIYDINGQLIQNEGFGQVGDSVSRLIHFNRNLATGMYMVHAVVDGERFATERMIIVH